MCIRDRDKSVLAVEQDGIRCRPFGFGARYEWTAANPVLLDGAYGLIRGSSPLKYKVGDGTKTWSALGWGNVTSLAQMCIRDRSMRRAEESDSCLRDNAGRERNRCENERVQPHAGTWANWR